MAQRIRREDLVDGIIDNSKLQNYTVTVSKIQTTDGGDGTGINAETLPFQHGFATPTIADKINAIISSNDWLIQTFNGDGVRTNFNIETPVDISQKSLVFFNGQILKDTYDYNLTSGNLFFLWTPENTKQIILFAQKL
jgi:hypothetical protein